MYYFYSIGNGEEWKCSSIKSKCLIDFSLKFWRQKKNCLKPIRISFTQMMDQFTLLRPWIVQERPPPTDNWIEDVLIEYENIIAAMSEQKERVFSTVDVENDIFVTLSSFTDICGSFQMSLIVFIEKRILFELEILVYFYIWE